MTDLLIFPFGGNAREALTAVLAQNSLQPRWNILGFLDDDERHWGVSFCDYSVLGGKQLISEYPESEILAVPGNPENYRSRESVITSLGLPADRFATILDPSVMVAPNAEIGYNTLVLANVFLSVSTKIGNHCVILPDTVISHDSQI